MSMLAPQALKWSSFCGSAGIRYPLQASATFTPSNDDASTVANTAAFLRGGKGSPTADASARAAQTAALNVLDAPTSRLTLTPSNDEASDISDMVTQLSSHTGTPSKNAAARGKLSSAVTAATSATSPPLAPRIGKATAPPTAKTTLPPIGKLATPAAKLAGQIPTTTAPSGPGIPFTPTNDDSSTIENAVTYLQGGTGSTAGKAAATAALGKAIQVSIATCLTTRTWRFRIHVLSCHHRFCESWQRRTLLVGVR